MIIFFLAALNWGFLVEVYRDYNESIYRFKN